MSVYGLEYYIVGRVSVYREGSSYAGEENCVIYACGERESWL